MVYCELGNTGMKASGIGLGWEGFTNEIVHAFEKSINCIDMYSSDPDLRKWAWQAVES